MTCQCFEAERGYWWLRVWGWGLSFVDHSVRGNGPWFSERNGFVRYLHVGPLCVKVLRPDWGRP